MGLFDRKKKEAIPDVGGAQDYSRSRQGPPSVAPSSASTYSQGAPPSYRTAPSYVGPSQGGGGYQNTSHYNRPPPPPQQGYGQPQRPPAEPVGAGKAKGSWFGGKNKGKEEEQQRNELLAGAPPPGQGPHGGQYGGQAGPQQPYGGYGGQQEQQYEDEEDEEVEGIKQQMRFVKQESLASTRNAVRIAREAEETARATLDKLGEQSDRLGNTEHHLDLAKAHNDRAVDETKELEALNRSIFRPNFTMNKAAKRDREERRLLDRHNAEKAEREQVRREQYESRQRIDGAFNSMDRAAESDAMRRAREHKRHGERARYQFEATASDDEVEDEIDDNLDELGGLAGRLKTLGMAMGSEVDAQNKKLGKMATKVDTLDNNVVRSTQRLGRVK
ncbi:uncharacterized protein JCM10292_000107 [Rhodotorula paludigena]|uniref:uncharacterized protein n=1 Tax=Rhodotorula paludigena TaxID=86838 RepID=UPI00317B83DD